MTVNPNAPMAPPQPQPQQKSSGCLKYSLIGCSILLVMGVLLALIVMAIVFGAIKSTDAYKEARNRALNDPRVIEALGAPVEAGFIVTGSVHVKNSTGTASINFPISGSRQKGTVQADAVLDAEGWHYSTLRVQPKSGPPIDLLARE